jgi:hypothetical protein
MPQCDGGYWFATFGLNLCGRQTQDGKVNEARLSSAATAIGLYRPGEMAEWLKAHAWKACVPQGTVGSNPTLSASDWNQQLTALVWMRVHFSC